MKVIHTEGATHTLNFEKGDEVVVGLLNFLKSKNIKAAHLTGLGAASEVTIAYYNLQTKSYEKQVITEDVEILSLMGNVGVKEDGELVVHIHGTFGRRDFSVFGGHIFEIKISGAGEIHLTSFAGTINRAYDSETGLTLMCPLSSLP
jgi:predicted DNA-binding protein with PD1-like motif